VAAAGRQLQDLHIFCEGFCSEFFSSHVWPLLPLRAAYREKSMPQGADQTGTPQPPADRPANPSDLDLLRAATASAVSKPARQQGLGGAHQAGRVCDRQSCAHCHGPDGKGGINLARRELDPKGVFQSITDGRENRGLRMPAWRGVMSYDEIWKLTAYVLSISQHPK
jgi:mono/diheme cytochrome c family protein